MSNRIVKNVLVVLFSITISACGGGGSSPQPGPIGVTPPPPDPPVLQSFSLLVEDNPGLDGDLTFD
ncbi:MAG: hypothetical protein VW874_06655, partial [Gammaproteobacteria bacterium]